MTVSVVFSCLSGDYPCLRTAQLRRSLSLRHGQGAGERFTAMLRTVVRVDLGDYLFGPHGVFRSCLEYKGECLPGLQVVDIEDNLAARNLESLQVVVFLDQRRYCLTHRLKACRHGYVEDDHTRIDLFGGRESNGGGNGDEIIHRDVLGAVVDSDVEYVRYLRLPLSGTL